MFPNCGPQQLYTVMDYMYLTRCSCSFMVPCTSTARLRESDILSFLSGTWIPITIKNWIPNDRNTHKSSALVLEY